MPNVNKSDASVVVEFKAELAVLLAKYDATIGVDVDGDTHGLMYDFTVEIGHKDHVICPGNRYIDASDLRVKTQGRITGGADDRDAR